jgi:integrase
MKIIKKHLKENYPDFFRFFALEYLTGLRPHELLNIKVKDIDYLNQRIVLPAAEGKTDETRFIPLPNAALKYLKELDTGVLPSNSYIFSTDFRPGSKCHGENGRADYATKRWKAFVKDELGLNVSLYSFKGKGGDDKRKAGVNAESVSSQYGHNSMSMTMRYLYGEQDRINKDIIEKTPEF